ncbi:hypothetical protein M441DRAFT_300203 [Trichoderma asperellum CBS 433.97]|uniref:Uncharacterized protein n=1 Tax=Trichoderma asperellum (strain ATCC 204424 / CBS 433.97 / NBRC 101777) TaxID=1042311 RepID=A0A2T3ZJ91_TRIA4|nr:hypothetical protein M441DRAFT_300203 [Trichoderma asperellum CBS 433.97]PTB44866.1 hypothetical protein M441DRAFT_300203 [Trichoderma asperellum CBS 433.97]
MRSSREVMANFSSSEIVNASEKITIFQKSIPLILAAGKVSNFQQLEPTSTPFVCVFSFFAHRVCTRPAGASSNAGVAVCSRAVWPRLGTRWPRTIYL